MVYFGFKECVETAIIVAIIALVGTIIEHLVKPVWVKWWKAEDEE